MTCNMMDIYGLLLEDGGHPALVARRNRLRGRRRRSSYPEHVVFRRDPGNRPDEGGRTDRPRGNRRGPGRRRRPGDRPSGYFNIKTARLKALCRFLSENDGGSRQSCQIPVPLLRRMLLGVHGVGRETADSIILYATNAIFRHRRLYKTDFSRMELVQADSDYDVLRTFFEKSCRKCGGLQRLSRTDCEMREGMLPKASDLRQMRPAAIVPGGMAELD